MYKLRCNCGQNELLFRRLTASDFPNGFEDECCKQKKEQEKFSDEQNVQIAEAIQAQVTKKRGRPKRAAP